MRCFHGKSAFVISYSRLFAVTFNSETSAQRVRVEPSPNPKASPQAPVMASSLLRSLCDLPSYADLWPCTFFTVVMRRSQSVKRKTSVFDLKLGWCDGLKHKTEPVSIHVELSTAVLVLKPMPKPLLEGPSLFLKFLVCFTSAQPNRARSGLKTSQDHNDSFNRSRMR